MYIYNDTCACIIIHVCLTLLASFFLPSHLSLKHVYGCKSIYALGFSQYLLRGFSTTISMSRHIYNYQTVSQYSTICKSCCFRKFELPCLLLPCFCSVWELCGDQALSVVTQISRTKSKHLVRKHLYMCVPTCTLLIFHVVH